jgi:hypothetical protein
LGILAQNGGFVHTDVLLFRADWGTMQVTRVNLIYVEVTMIEVTISNVAGIREAMRGMRLAFKSESDTAGEVIGEKDLARAQSLRRAGRDSHAKFSRFITVWLTIRAPWAWWKQWATYKVGNDEMSTSSMHTLMRGVGADDFDPDTPPESMEVLQRAIETGNLHRAEMALPGGYLYTRQVKVNYQTLRNMWLDRWNHRLHEWQGFFDQLATLPYADELIFVR